MEMWTEALECGTVQGLPVFRMGNGNQQPGSLLKTLAVQVHGAIFGYNPVSIGAWRYYTSARMYGGYYLGSALACPGCKCSNALSTFR